MQPDVIMTSIEFKSYASDAIDSVQCNLSNGQSSPLFDCPSGNKNYPQTLIFDKNRPVRAVAACDGNGRRNHMNKMKFMD